MFGNKNKTNELLHAKINTLIGEHSEIEGVLKFKGGLHVVGKITGDAISDDPESLLILNENAHITGDIKVGQIIVNGLIEGEIYVDGKVELFDKGRINGDVHYKTLELSEGAEINGKLIRIDQDSSESKAS